MADPDLDPGAAATPSPPLRALVQSYQGYRAEPRPGGVHRGAPSGTLTVVLTLDEPIQLLRPPDPTASAGRYDALVGGLHSRPALMTWSSPQTGLQLALTPLGARQLLGVPAGELAQQVVTLDTLWGRAGTALLDHLRAASSWSERFAAVDAALLRRLARHDKPAPAIPEVTRAWQLLERAGGRRRIATLADDVGWSRRHLGQRFRDELGLTPQTAGRVMRFDQARQALRPGCSLAALAAAHGFADQAHLTREFHTFAGCTPTRWLAEEWAS